MSTPSIFQNPAFQTASPSPIGFNLIPQTNNFNAIFDTKPLDADESLKLERLLSESSESMSEEQLERDTLALSQITAEIKAIGKQGTVLQGERVHRAKQLLKPYRDGTFTKWLESTFGTRKTGYNVLAYYELYNALPGEDIRNSFKKMQQRTAYMLASRSGDIETKAEIISQNSGKRHDEIVSLMNERLPIPEADKRAGKPSIEKMLKDIQAQIEKLEPRASEITEGDKIVIGGLIDQLGSFMLNV